MNKDKTLDELREDLRDMFCDVLACTQHHGSLPSEQAFLETMSALIAKAQESQREKIALHAESFKWTQNHPSGALYEFAQAIRGTE